MANRIYAGIDLHKTQFTVCILADENILETGTQYPVSPEGFCSFISQMQALSVSEGDIPVSLAIESTSNSRHFKETMEANGFEVTVVNTLRFKVVNLSTKKTDKNDASTLAEFLAKQMLPQSHLCSPQNEGLRRILKSRALMVSDATALKNQAHSVLLAYGIITVPAQFQSKKSRCNMISSLSGETKEIVEAIFQTLDAVEEQTKILEGKLRKFTHDNSTVANLMTIPGIGIVNACTICAYTDDISRFDTYKNYSAYCGLVPWVQTSNQTTYYGHITKRGPAELRTALVQCVIAMVRMPDKTGETTLMRQYRQMKETKCSGKAIIAIARRLSRIIWVMLKTGTAFDMNRLCR